MNLVKGALLAATSLLYSCATSQDSVLLGAGVGATTGAAFGAAAGQGNHNELRAGAVGAATGAAFGALMGYLKHRTDTEQAVKTALPIDAAPPPSLTKPEVRKVWVPDQVDGDKLVRGHFVFILEKGSVWRDDSH